MLLLKIKYRVKYYWGEFMELCGYCRKCGMKMSVTGRGRKVCTYINCGVK